MTLGWILSLPTYTTGPTTKVARVSTRYKTTMIIREKFCGQRTRIQWMIESEKDERQDLRSKGPPWKWLLTMRMIFFPGWDHHLGHCITFSRDTRMAFSGEDMGHKFSRAHIDTRTSIQQQQPSLMSYIQVKGAICHIQFFDFYFY